ncbi:hypothetical protein ACFIOY_28855 [Bradyrhizobium sp. TZ2]
MKTATGLATDDDRPWLGFRTHTVSKKVYDEMPAEAASPDRPPYRKGFPNLGGDVLAAMALSELESFDSAAQAKRNLRKAIEKVSARLGNTPTI